MKKMLLFMVILSTFSVSGIKYYEKQTINGQYYSKKNVKSLINCAYSCDNQKKCKAFNYRGNTSICTLLDSYSSLGVSNGITSGLKIRGKKVALIKHTEAIKIKTPVFKIKKPKKKIEKPKPKKVVPKPYIAKTIKITEVSSSPSFFESISSGVTSLSNSISKTFSSTKTKIVKKEKIVVEKSEPYQNKYDEVEVNTIEETQIITDGDTIDIIKNIEVVSNDNYVKQKNNINDLSEDEKTSIINNFVYKEVNENNQKYFKPTKQEGYCTLFYKKNNKKLTSNNCTFRKYILKGITKYKITFNNGVDMIFEEKFGEFTYLSFEDGEIYPAELNLKEETAIFDIYKLKYHIY